MSTAAAQLSEHAANERLRRLRESAVAAALGVDHARGRDSDSGVQLTEAHADAEGVLGRVPVLLLARTEGTGGNAGPARGTDCGWELLVPAPVAAAVWHRLVHCGGHAVGIDAAHARLLGVAAEAAASSVVQHKRQQPQQEEQQEEQQRRRQQPPPPPMLPCRTHARGTPAGLLAALGAPAFPLDWPDTVAGAAEATRRAAVARAAWERRPKGRRLEFQALDVGAPWAPDWAGLCRLPQWEQEQSSLCAAAEDSGGGSSAAATTAATATAAPTTAAVARQQWLPRVVRDPAILALPPRALHAALHEEAGAAAAEQERSASLVCVVVRVLGKGTPAPNAMICRPQGDRFASGADWGHFLGAVGGGCLRRHRNGTEVAAVAGAGNERWQPSHPAQEHPTRRGGVGRAERRSRGRRGRRHAAGRPALVQTMLRAAPAGCTGAGRAMNDVGDEGDGAVAAADMAPVPRETVGYLTSGGHAVRRAAGVGVGFVRSDALASLAGGEAGNCACGRCCFVLLRNTNSMQYMPAIAAVYQYQHR